MKLYLYIVKKFFQKIASLTMAVLLLLSTVSWTVDKHLCMGRVMDVALFAKADDCGMYAAMEAMGASSDENHCCGDESFTVQGQDDLKISFNDITFDQQLFLVAFTHVYLDLFPDVQEHILTNEYYPPPILIKDIQLLDAVFLI